MLHIMCASANNDVNEPNEMTLVQIDFKIINGYRDNNEDYIFTDVLCLSIEVIKY